MPIYRGKKRLYFIPRTRRFWARVSDTFTNLAMIWQRRVHSSSSLGVPFQPQHRRVLSRWERGWPPTHWGTALKGHLLRKGTKVQVICGWGWVQRRKWQLGHQQCECVWVLPPHQFCNPRRVIESRWLSFPWLYLSRPPPPPAIEL